MTGVLKKIVEDYSKAPTIRPGKKVSARKLAIPRVDLFLERYTKETEVLKTKELNQDIFNEGNFYSISPEDFWGLGEI
jgi:hypothetical protein